MKKKIRDSYLDGEKLFRHYCKMGGAKSIGILRRYAVSENMFDPTNNKEPTRMGVWKAMWRWASLKENRDTAYQLFLETHQQDIQDDEWLSQYFPDSINRKDWDALMLKRIDSAWQFRTPMLRQKFLQKNGWS